MSPDQDRFSHMKQHIAQRVRSVPSPAADVCPQQVDPVMRSVLIVFHVIAFSFFVVKNIKLPDSVLKLDECHCCLNASSASWRTDGDTRLQQNHTRSQFIRYFNRNKKTANKTDKTF